jgi:hypothetical protein
MCLYGSSGTVVSTNGYYGAYFFSSYETSLPTHASCGFAITVADTNTSNPKPTFSLAAKPDTTYIAVGASSVTPSAVFAPLQYFDSNGALGWAKGSTLVTALNPHPTKLMVYHTVTDSFMGKREDYDIRTVALIDMATTPPTATMHLDLKTSAAANIATIRWYKLIPGPDGEKVFLIGLVKLTPTTLKYGRYVPGSVLTVQDTPYDDQPTSIAGIYAN